MTKKVSREQFKAQFGQDSMAELRTMATNNLGIKVPVSIDKEKLLDLMYEGYAGVDSSEPRAAESKAADAKAVESKTDKPTSPPPPPAVVAANPAGPAKLVIKCVASRGIWRGGRFWKCGKHVVIESDLPSQVLKALKKDKAFVVETL